MSPSFLRIRKSYPFINITDNLFDNSYNLEFNKLLCKWSWSANKWFVLINNKRHLCNNINHVINYLYVKFAKSFSV